MCRGSLQIEVKEVTSMATVAKNVESGEQDPLRENETLYLSTV